MTLRKRLLWLFIPLLALTMLVAYGLSERILLSRFDRQDQVLLLNDAERLRSLLDYNLKRNLELVYSYSRWDDSYEFMQGTKPDFVRRNMDEESLIHMNFDFMVYLSEDNQVAAEQWLPPDLAEMLTAGGERPTSYESLRAAILQLSERLIKRNAQQQITSSSGQLLVVQGVPLMLVVSPITNNEGNTLPNGNIVAGHFIDAERLRSLKNQLAGDLQLVAPPADTTDWIYQAKVLDSSLSGMQVSPRRLPNDQRQEIDLLFENDLNEPGLTLQLGRNRQLFQEGQQAILFFLGLSVTVGIGALLLIYLSLEYRVLRRLQRIHKEVALIGPNNPLPRLSDQGRDELGQLAHGLNQMFERLAESETRDQLILDSINDGYFEVDARGTLTRVNHALGKLLGYSSSEMLGKSYKWALQKEDVQRARDLLIQARQARPDSVFAAPFKRRDGSLGYFETRLAFFYDRDNQVAGCRGILRDISEQMAYQSQLLDMAYRDPLTGLGNRKAFAEQLQRSMDNMQRKQQSLALLYIDLDHFKEVNDQFGHDAGDALLITIAERLRNTLRQPDLVYRLGGDEFTLLLIEADADSAVALAERLVNRLSQPFRQGDLQVDFVTPSIGIALFPQHASNADSLIKAADSAMYEAKKQRHRACLYNPESLSPEPQTR